MSRNIVYNRWRVEIMLKYGQTKASNNDHVIAVRATVQRTFEAPGRVGKESRINTKVEGKPCTNWGKTVVSGLHHRALVD